MAVMTPAPESTSMAVRLHLLGQDRVAVDTGADTYTLFHDVPHPVRGSLLIMGNRVRRAELWLADRENADIESFTDMLTNMLELLLVFS